MELLLTILSVLALWALLSTLVLGLLAILRPLQSIRGYLEKITMGVRAIEQQTGPLGGRADALASHFERASGTLGAAAERMTRVEQGLGAAAPALRSR